MLISQYTKAEAMSREDRLIAGHAEMLKKAKCKAKRSGPKNFYGKRSEKFNESKDELFSLCTDEWQGSRDFADILDRKPATTLTRMKRLVDEGKAEGRRIKGKMYIRLPQVDEDNTQSPPNDFEIMYDFARKNDLTMEDLSGRGKDLRLNRIRQDCMAEIYRRCGMSSTEIGRLFGRDPSTILAAIKASENRAREQSQ